jgi:hypothetical protein
MERSGDSDRERFALAALESVELVAPPRLRARIDAERERARRPARRRRLALSGAFAGAAAALVLALLLVLPGGAGGPTVVEAAELGQLPATGPPPGQAGPFPDWAKTFGWRATGRRVDELDGRRVVTVFYEKEGRELAYSIVDGNAIPWPADWRRAEVAGTRFDHRAEDGRLVVTWRRKDGRSCVLSGSGAQLEKVLELASWKPAA